MATNVYVDINLEEAKSLADYTSINFDLRSAKEFAKLLLEKTEQIDLQHSDALTVATLIRYARAFASGIRLRLSAEEILSDQQQTKHNKIIAIRDKYVAHSVNAFEESQPIARYWVERVHEEGITSIECTHGRIVGLGISELQDIIGLADIWLAHVEKKLGEEKARLLEIVRKIPLEELLQTKPKAILADTSQPERRRSR